MQADVLVAGSLHYDVIVRAPRLPAKDETLAGSSVAYAFGGKGGNQAIACARHGAATAFAGRIGNDEAGRFMRAHLEKACVDIAMLETDHAHATGMSVAILDEAGDYGAVIVSGANLHIDSETISIPTDCRLVLLQNETPKSVNLAIARKAHEAGARILLNAAPARALDPARLALVDFLVVNRIEAAMLSGHPVETHDDACRAAQTLSGAGRSVVVTLGSNGCIHCEPGGRPMRMGAYPVRQISSHGAGDCFTGAFAARLAQGEAFGDALVYASVAAALHVSTAPEARDAITPEDVMKLIADQLIS